VSPRERALLQAAKARLDALDWYPRRVRLRHVRVVTAPWLFRLPWLRRFEGYATWWVVFVRAPLDEVSEDLVTHELCHVWQMQHHPLRMPLSYLVRGYAANPYELEARRAAASWPGQASTGTRG
jgi:hypothetical protein